MATATVIGAAGPASLCGRVGCGLIADRLGGKQSLIAGLLLQATVVVLYVFVGNLASFYPVAAMFGLAYAGMTPLYAILVREYSGAPIIGTVFGAVAMASILGMALAPVARGWLFDTWGIYFWLYIGSAGIGLGAVAIALLFRPPTVRRRSRYKAPLCRAGCRDDNGEIEWIVRAARLSLSAGDSLDLATTGGESVGCQISDANR